MTSHYAYDVYQRDDVSEAIGLSTTGLRESDVRMCECMPAGDGEAGHSGFSTVQ